MKAIETIREVMKVTGATLSDLEKYSDLRKVGKKMIVICETTDCENNEDGYCITDKIHLDFCGNCKEQRLVNKDDDIEI